MLVCKDDGFGLPVVYYTCEAVNDGNEQKKRKQNIAAGAYEQHKWRENKCMLCFTPHLRTLEDMEFYCLGLQ